MFIEPRHFKTYGNAHRLSRIALGCFSAILLLAAISWIAPSSSLSLTPAVAQAQAPDLIIDKRVSNSTPEPGELFSYLIRYRCASVEDHCENAQISDFVPSALTVVNYTRQGGNIASAAANENHLTWNLETAFDTPGQLSAGSSGTIVIEARFPACSETETQDPAAGTMISNVANFTADNADPVSTAAGSADVTMPELEVCPVEEIVLDEGFRKTPWVEDFANPGNPRVTYKIVLVDSAVSYVVEDEFPAGTTLESSSFSNLVTSGGTVELKCDGNWFDLTPTLEDKLNNPTDVPEDCTAEQALGTGVAYWFNNAQAIRFTTPDNFDADENTPLDLIFLLDGNHPVGGILRNTAVLYEPDGVDLTGDGIPGDTVYSHADKLVVEPSMMGSIEVDEFIYPGYLNTEGISVLTGNKELPNYIASGDTNHANLNLTTGYLAKNDVVWKYRAQMRNDATIGMNWVNPVMIVDLPKEMDFVQDPEIGNFVQVGIPNKTTITSDFDPYNNDNCETPEVSVINDFNSTGRTRVRMDFPGCTIYGGMQQYAGIALYFSSRIKPGTSIDEELVIDFRMYDENGLMFRCFGNDTVYKNWCGTSSSITVSNLPVESYTTLESFMFAKGSLDAEYHRFPQLGYSAPDGQVDFEAYVINTGNVSHRHVDLVDVLPNIGDTSITTSVERDSSWEQELRDDISVEKLDLDTGEWTAVPSDEITRGPYYSSSTNPCRLGTGGAELYVDNDLAVTPSGCDSNVWGPTTPEALGARSFGLRWIPTEGFGPNEEIRISIPAQQVSSANSCNVYTDDFGASTARADLAPTIGTDLTFDDAGAIDPGSYALMHTVQGTADESGNMWHNVTEDFTQADTDGRMMVINASNVSGELYRKTIDNLVTGGDYSITIWVANALEGESADPGRLNMAVEPVGGGTAYSSADTPPVRTTERVGWKAYSFGFTADAASVDFVLSTAE